MGDCRALPGGTRAFGMLGGAMPGGGLGTVGDQGLAGTAEGVFARAVSVGLVRSVCCVALAERERSRALSLPGVRALVSASSRATAA